MQILRLLVARRRAVSTITAVAPSPSPECDDEGPFFDLDLSACSVRASLSSSRTISGCDSDSDDDRTELDFIISMQRTRSASPSYDALLLGGAAPLKFCASGPPPKAKASRKRGIGSLRTLSFGRHSFARSSSSSARSLRLFMASPPADEDQEEQTARRAPSWDVIRKYLTKISRRLCGAEARGLRRLRKCRSASGSRRGDSVLEKQDGIAGAIAYCKESLHRAPMSSECGSPLLRSWSDTGKCEAA